MDVTYSILTGVITTRYSPQDIDTIGDDELDSINEFERSTQGLIDPETDFHSVRKYKKHIEEDPTIGWDPVYELEEMDEQGAKRGTEL
jgi:hypothetical protein